MDVHLQHESIVINAHQREIRFLVVTGSQLLQSLARTFGQPLNLGVFLVVQLAKMIDCAFQVVQVLSTGAGTCANNPRQQARVCEPNTVVADVQLGPVWSKVQAVDADDGGQGIKRGLQFRRSRRQ